MTILSLIRKLFPNAFKTKLEWSDSDPGVCRLPSLGDGAEEATVVRWHVLAGDAVEKNQSIVDLETDKAFVELLSPRNGVIRELLGEPGAVVEVGEPLWTFWSTDALSPRSRTLEIVPPHPDWAEKFGELKERLASLLDGVAPFSIEHVGSTSVPGLWAKPVIDVSVVLERSDAVSPVIRALETAGYTHLGDLGVAGREAFRQPDETTPHNLYVGVWDAAAIRNHLAFRDALRSHPALVDRYSELKRQLVSQHSGDIDGYTAAKTDFVISVLESYGSFSPVELDAIRRANTE